MWMVLMFDLPVIEKAERKAATQFRKVVHKAHGTVVFFLGRLIFWIGGRCTLALHRQIFRLCRRALRLAHGRDGGQGRLTIGQRFRRSLCSSLRRSFGGGFCCWSRYRFRRGFLGYSCRRIFRPCRNSRSGHRINRGRQTFVIMYVLRTPCVLRGRRSSDHLRAQGLVCAHALPPFSEAAAVWAAPAGAAGGGSW